MQVGGQLLFGLRYIGMMNSATIVLHFVLENSVLCKMSSFLSIDKQVGMAVEIQIHIWEVLGSNMF
jgi:hypothetical protein